MEKHFGKKSPKAFSSIIARSPSDGHKYLPTTNTIPVDDSKNLRKGPAETDAYLHRNLTLENARNTKNESFDVNKRIFSETSHHNKAPNQVLPLPNSDFGEETENPGYGFLRTAESPKLSRKLEKNLSHNMDLSKSIINGSQKVISDAVITADGKDLQTELQLGELTLCNLDKKLSKCLEHSRRTLSMTEAYSQKANSVLTPDKRSLFMDSSIPSPARKSSNDSGFGNRKLSHSNSSGLSVAKKASDISMRSLAMTRETTGEELFMPAIEVKDSSIRVRPFESKVIPIRELTSTSQTIFANNIIPRSRTKAEYIEASKRHAEQDLSKNKTTPSISRSNQNSGDQMQNESRGRNIGQDPSLVIKKRKVQENLLFDDHVRNPLPPSPELLNRSLEESQNNIPSACDLKPVIKAGVKKAVLESLRNQTEIKMETNSTVGKQLTRDDNTIIESSINGISTTENLLFNQSFEQIPKSSPLLLVKTSLLNQSRSQDGLDGSMTNSPDIDAQFAKAFSIVKNKVIHQGANFDERMRSDILFRRRFDDDLLEFRKMIKPKISEEKATELYSKLVEDGKKRALRSRHIEKQKQIVRQERAKVFYESLSLQTDDEHQKVFERLVGDSKERAREKERKEIERQEKLEKEENDLLNLSNQKKKKMDKQSVQKLVNKLVKDAERRKHSVEKTELLKVEGQNKSVAIARQKSPEKTKQVESKVKQYINRAIERNIHVRQTSLKQYEKIVPTATATPKKMRFNTEQKNVKNIFQKNAPVPLVPIPVLSEEPLKKEKTNSFEAALHREIKEIKESCIKEAWKANIDYLRGLRGDIEKIRDNIEQKIEDIERGNFAWPEDQNLPRAKEKTQEAPEQILKHSRSHNHSLERAPEKLSRPKSRVRNQSIAIDPSSKKRETQSQQRIPRATSSANNFFKDQDSASKSIFMTDQKAQSYVTQLIQDFREIHNIKPHLRR